MTAGINQVKLIITLMLFCMPSLALSATHGHGLVRLKGNIIDTACAIAIGDIDQSIDMGSLAISELINKGREPAVDFTVHLENCVLNDSNFRKGHYWKDIHVTFEGEADGPDGFALHGDAHGERLAISDSIGDQAEPGKPMPDLPLTPGKMNLRYKLWLTSDHKALRTGNFYITIRYFMEYD